MALMVARMFMTMCSDNAGDYDADDYDGSICSAHTTNASPCVLNDFQEEHRV